MKICKYQEENLNGNSLLINTACFIFGLCTIIFLIFICMIRKFHLRDIFSKLMDKPLIHFRLTVWRFSIKYINCTFSSVLWSKNIKSNMMLNGDITIWKMKLVQFLISSLYIFQKYHWKNTLFRVFWYFFIVMYLQIKMAVASLFSGTVQWWLWRKSLFYLKILIMF